MLKRLLSVLLIAAVFATAANATDRVSDRKGADYERTGRVDAVYFEENRIVIDDIPYALADYLRIYAPGSNAGSKTVPRARLRSGLMVGFKAGRGRLVSEIWILPKSADRRRGR